MEHILNARTCSKLEHKDVFKAMQQIIFTMVTYFLRWTLLKFFSSFPDEQSQQKVRQLDRITAQWLIHQMKLRAFYCGNFEFIIFLWEFEKGSFVGSIVDIRNECLFFWVHGEWIVARNKQIGREPLRGSRDLFVPCYDSFPMNTEKKDTHSLIERKDGFNPLAVFNLKHQAFKIEHM